MIKPLKATKIEHDTEKKIMTTIVQRKGYVIKNQASATTGKGRPDLSACIKGKYYGIEVKRPMANVTTTTYQIQALISIANAGGYAYYSKTADMFNLRKYSVKTLHYKKNITVEDIKPCLRLQRVLVIQIINAKTIKLYSKKVI